MMLCLHIENASPEISSANIFLLRGKKKPLVKTTILALYEN